MNKILVIATGWHFSSHFYEEMVKQVIPNSWSVDYFCVAHRLPENENTISEKESARNSDSDNFLYELDKLMYKYPITTQQISRLGWKFMVEDNTVGDMECFNQWSEHFDYRDYDFVLITHDDNLILSNQLFVDIVSGVDVHKPIVESRYNTHQFNTEMVELKNDWLFLDNGYTEHIPKAFEPRGSFSFYKKELIDMLPDNKFDMYQEGGLGIVNRVGETNSVGHDGISAWNAHSGTFRNFLYDSGLVENTRWLSDKKRVSKYCVEGERGFVSNYKADGIEYVHNLEKILREKGWI